MACCILAAFLIGQGVWAWHWLKRRLGGSTAVPAALWSGQAVPAVIDSASRVRYRPRPTLTWVSLLCIAMLALGAVVAAASGVGWLRQGIARSATWCFGEPHD